MTLLGLFLLIVVVGIVVYVIRRYTPIDQQFKDIVLWVGIAVVVVALLHAFGVLDAIRGVQVPRI